MSQQRAEGLLTFPTEIAVFSRSAAASAHSSFFNGELAAAAFTEMPGREGFYPALDAAHNTS
jgi:hypothetical protein